MLVRFRVCVPKHAHFYVSFASEHFMNLFFPLLWVLGGIVEYTIVFCNS